VDTTAVVVIGAGPAGLAMSRCLTDRQIEHVVLERADVASSWRTERWDSLRLLTPNWMTRLPGYQYDGPDPTGFLAKAEVIDLLDRYAAATGAPVRTGTSVTRVGVAHEGFHVSTDRGSWRCRAVVIATGACSTPRVPALGTDLPAHLRQLAAIHYRRPDQIDAGDVLVVGASASGVQLAEELALAGRHVTLAVGAHTRLPRTYRGIDIHQWMEWLGLLDEPYDQVQDLAKVRRLPSLQLVGSPERRTLDLNTLTSLGVELVGRLVGTADGQAQLAGSLAAVCADADLKMGRLLDQVDALGDGLRLPSEPRPRPTRVPEPRNVVPLRHFSTVIWATGFRPSFPFLDPSLLDRRGAVVHTGGVTAAPGMYVLGLPFLRRRKSSFLDGIGADAVELSDRLAGNLATRSVAVPTQNCGLVDNWTSSIRWGFNPNVRQIRRSPSGSDRPARPSTGSTTASNHPAGPPPTWSR
jgi:putative flavoprotein involved in K+ transport